MRHGEQVDAHKAQRTIGMHLFLFFRLSPLVIVSRGSRGGSLLTLTPIGIVPALHVGVVHCQTVDGKNVV